MGTPTDRDRATDTRTRLLDEAARSFAARGYRSTSISAVARSVGVSPPTAYFHFDDKNALFVAAFDREAEALCDSVIGDPDALGGGYWETALFRIATDIRDHPLVFRVVSGQEPGLLRRLFDGVFSQRLCEALATSIRLGQDDGVIRRDLDPDIVAVGLGTVFISLIVSAVQIDAPGDNERGDAVRYVLRQAFAQS